MNWKKALLAGTALSGAGLLSAGADAQTAAGTYTTQTANRPDAATQMSSVTSTNCTATGTSVANLTLTMTPAAGNYVYLQSFVVEVAPGNTTGAASTAAYSSTNLTGNPAWLISAATVASTAPQAEVAQVNDFYPTGLKATAPGTAVTLLPTATLNSTLVCAHATWWQGP